MKTLFPGSYPLSEVELKLLWSEGRFVFDASMLLNFYRYSDQACKEFLALVSSPDVAPRIWIPYQVALEYHRCLDAVRHEPVEKCREIVKDIEAWMKKSRAADHQERGKELLSVANRFLHEAEEHYRHPDRHSLIAQIAELFEGKVGPEMSEDVLSKIYKEGENRFALEIPPGFKDRTKKGNDKYGDLVVWRQILNEAKTQKKPVIFISDDAKDDWWLDIDGRKVGPLAALRNEMYREAGTIFHMYSGNGFLKQAKDRLKRSIADTTLKEVERVRAEKRAAMQQEFPLPSNSKETRWDRRHMHAIRVEHEAADRVEHIRNAFALRRDSGKTISATMLKELEDAESELDAAKRAHTEVHFEMDMHHNLLGQSSK